LLFYVAHDIIKKVSPEAGWQSPDRGPALRFPAFGIRAMHKKRSCL
jgi:hypothetical protein